MSNDIVASITTGLEGDIGFLCKKCHQDRTIHFRGELTVTFDSDKGENTAPLLDFHKGFSLECGVCKKPMTIEPEFCLEEIAALSKMGYDGDFSNGDVVYEMRDDKYHVVYPNVVFEPLTVNGYLADALKAVSKDPQWEYVIKAEVEHCYDDLTPAHYEAQCFLYGDYRSSYQNLEDAQARLRLKQGEFKDFLGEVIKHLETAREE